MTGLSSDELGRAGLEWLLATADAESDDDPTLYSGAAGIALAYVEGYRHFGDERYADAALRAGREIVERIDEWEHSALYFGVAGMAFALQTLGDELDDETLRASARKARGNVVQRFDGERWGPQIELLGGNAGIALAALAFGDRDLALAAVEPYARLAEPTTGGTTWESRASREARLHHISHGTLGIAYALAAVGDAYDRADLIDLAKAGAADVVARNDSSTDDFRVPHSDPQDKPDLVERYSYGWCNGPAGDAQAFRLFHQLTGDPEWSQLVDRCWQTVRRSGLPARVRPGFWDNNGRCCGTAGVLALACDREVEAADGVAFADVLVADLAARATIDSTGARWSNVEYRATPSALDPKRGWAMGNAGIVRELLRYSRVSARLDPSYTVTWPDQPVAVRHGAESRMR